MLGLISIVIGALLVLLAPMALLPQVIGRLEDDLDAPHWRSVRQIKPLKPMLDWHYQVSKKLSRVVVPAFLLMLGLVFIVTGISKL